jgi:hypothetical protein
MALVERGSTVTVVGVHVCQAPMFSNAVLGGTDCSRAVGIVSRVVEPRHPGEWGVGSHFGTTFPRTTPPDERAARVRQVPWWSGVDRDGSEIELLLAQGDAHRHDD